MGEGEGEGEGKSAFIEPGRPLTGREEIWLSSLQSTDECMSWSSGTVRRSLLKLPILKPMRLNIAIICRGSSAAVTY